MLTPLPLVPHIHVSELCQHWFRHWLIVCPAPSHYHNQCWLIVNWTPGNKFQWFKGQYIRYTPGTMYSGHFDCHVDLLCPSPSISGTINLSFVCVIIDNTWMGQYDHIVYAWRDIIEDCFHKKLLEHSMNVWLHEAFLELIVTPFWDIDLGQHWLRQWLVSHSRKIVTIHEF